MTGSGYKKLKITAIIQLVNGAFGIILGITNIYVGIDFIPYFAVAVGFWVCITGCIGLSVNRDPTSRAIKPLVGVYMGFSIVSVVSAATFIICYSFSMVIFHAFAFGLAYPTSNYDYIIPIVILLVSLFEFGIGIWASVCCCIIGPCCQERQMAPVGQMIYLQSQERTLVPCVVVQRSHGTSVVVPVQIGGPMSEPCDTNLPDSRETLRVTNV